MGAIVPALVGTVLSSSMTAVKSRVESQNLYMMISSKMPRRTAETRVVSRIRPVSGPTMKMNIWNSMPLIRCGLIRLRSSAWRNRWYQGKR